MMTHAPTAVSFVLSAMMCGAYSIGLLFCMELDFIAPFDKNALLFLALAINAGSLVLTIIACRKQNMVRLTSFEKQLYVVGTQGAILFTPFSIILLWWLFGALVSTGRIRHRALDFGIVLVTSVLNMLSIWAYSTLRTFVN